MRTSTIRRTIAAPPEAVYDWLVDPANWTVPGVSGGRFTGTQRSFRLGPIPVSEDVPYAERPVGFDYVLKGLPPLLRNGGNSVRLAPAAGGGTLVTYTLRTDVAVPAVGDALARPAEMAMSLVVKQLLDGAEKALTKR